MNKQLWKTLLTLSAQVANTKEHIHFCALRYQNSIQVFFNQIPKDWPASELLIVELDEAVSLSSEYAIFSRKNKIRFFLKQAASLSTDTIKAFQHYLPYCFLPIHARQEGRTIAIAHFAQTLDGKIATYSGDSHWIGNDENLEHAHRMRALCGAILVGGNTLLEDAPRLTVRRVEGENPVRVILSSQQRDYSSLLDCCKEPIWVLSPKTMESNGQIKVFELESHKGKISCENILKYLYQKGIYSVLIEGGSMTTSNFIKESAIDILQLHISPLLFGSGKTAIVLPEIEKLKDAVQFKDFYFQAVGDAIMFVGCMER